MTLTMRIRHLTVRMVFLLSLMVSTNCAESTFGTWTVNANRSRMSGGSLPKTLTVRIEPHAKGEVFTLDRTEADGRVTSSSTILYLDGAPRDSEDFECSGMQSSRRLDNHTIEIVRKCGGCDRTWLVRQSAKRSKELIIDITEKRLGGPNLAWRVVLEKQE